MVKTVVSKVLEDFTRIDILVNNAGALIAKEAGAIISTPSGDEFDLFKGDILAIAPSLYQEFIELIKKG